MGGLDLGKAETLHLTAQEGNHFGAQDNIILDLLIAQIQEPVLQADFLLAVSVDALISKGQILHDLAQEWTGLRHAVPQYRWRSSG